MEKKKNTKKIIAIAAVIGLTIASAAINYCLRPSDTGADIGTDTVIEQQAALPNTNIFFEEEVKKKKNTGRSKSWSLMSIPLWVCGQIAALLLKPILGRVLTSLLIAAVFFGIFCLCLKIIFPNKPLKELLSPRNLLSYALCTGAFIAAFNIPRLMDTQTTAGNTIMLLAGCACAIAMVILSKDTDIPQEIYV